MRVLLAILLIVVLMGLVQGRSRKSRYKCAQPQRFVGCRVRSKTHRCSCGKVKRCTNPFPYTTKKQCERYTRDICKRTQPCENGGFCEVLTKKTYNCQCSGTGYHGTNCETVCPTFNRLSSLIWKYPTECINI